MQMSLNVRLSQVNQHRNLKTASSVRKKIDFYSLRSISTDYIIYIFNQNPFVAKIYKLLNSEAVCYLEENW